MELVADALPGDRVTVTATMPFGGDQVEWVTAAVAPASVPLAPPATTVGRLAGQALVTVLVEVTVERDGVVWSRSSAPRLQASWDRGPDAPPTLWTVAEAAERAPLGLPGAPARGAGSEAEAVAAGTWTATRTWRSE